MVEITWLTRDLYDEWVPIAYIIGGLEENNFLVLIRETKVKTINYKLCKSTYKTKSFRVFKYDLESEGSEGWLVLKDLGRRALSVRYNALFWMEEDPARVINGNYIYYTDDDPVLYGGSIKGRGRDMGIYHMYNGTIESHYIEEPHSLRTPPIWIKMAKEDEEKMTFITSQGIFCYSKIPFGLKNAGATYQRLVDKAFQKQIGRNLEVCVEDQVIKSRTKQETIKGIKETFRTLREINMKLNPKKFTFGVEEGIFMGYKGEYDIQCRPRTSVKGQILADFIVECPKDDSFVTTTKAEEELPNLWTLFTNGSSCIDVANQVNGSYIAKESGMMQYLEKVKTLISNSKSSQSNRSVSSRGGRRRHMDDSNLGIPHERNTPCGKRKGKGHTAQVKTVHCNQQSPIQEILSWTVVTCFASIKHPQHNGLVKRANRSLGEGIQARLDERSNDWIEEVPHVLWNDEALKINLDLLEERREQAAICEARSKAKIEKYYNFTVRNTSFKPGDLVYRNNNASRAKDNRKLSPKWEGPYEVKEALGKGAYKLKDCNKKLLS
nr:reverse transcriptase domain-containing protein [Tanacetum cinerariifolium]